MSPPQFCQFLNTPEPAELGPGCRPGTQSQEQIEEQLRPLLKTSSLPEERQQLVRALLLLWHDHLDTAHTLAQEVDNPDGAFVHGIMHRREPDFGNAGYWFRRVGRHAAFPAIAQRVEQMLQGNSERALAAKVIRGGQWDAFGFIDACEAVSTRPGATSRVLREVQRVEFEGLLNSLLRAE
jgi:NADPH-dependent ferric siderophore reductase